MLERENLREKIFIILESCIILKPSMIEPDTVEKFTDIIMQEVEKSYLKYDYQVTMEREKVQ